MLSPEWKSIYAEFESIKRDGSKRNNTSDYWFRSLSSGKEYYLRFDSYSPPPGVIYNSLKSPLFSNSDTDAIHIFVDQREEKCAWKPYMEPPFIAEGLTTIEDANLVVLKTIRRGVDVVRVEGYEGLYIHKYMTPYSFTEPFNIEVNNYRKVGESCYVPKLVGAVNRNNEIRGFLLSAIDGDDLSELTLTVDEKLDVTIKLLQALVDLESRSYFPQDLKPENIMIRHVDKSLAIIDLGDGRTPGYYRDRSHSERLQDREIPPAGKFMGSDSFYTIGRTLWAIWLDDPDGFNDDTIPATFPPLISELIGECCCRTHFSSIEKLYLAYSERLKNDSDVTAYTLDSYLLTSKGQMKGKKC